MQIYSFKRLLKITVTLLVIASSSICIAETSFNEYFDMEPVINTELADRISNYYNEDIPLSNAQQKIELASLEQKLKALENTHKDNPIYWFIAGMHNKNMATYYTTTNNSEMAYKHIKLKDSAYEKAIKLDKDASEKLSASIYSSMKHGLPEALKIEATQGELAVGGNGESDSYYWYLHWSNIDQLQNAGRTEEAEQAFKNMQKELKDSKTDMSIYGALNQQIEKKTFNKEQPKPSKPKPVKKKEKPKKKEPLFDLDKKYTIILGITVITILLFTIVIVYERKSRKNRKRK